MVQQINIFFCVKLGWSQAHTILVIQTIFGQDALCRTSIRKLFNSFKNGRTQLVDLACTPTTRLVKAKQMLTESRLWFWQTGD